MLVSMLEGFACAKFQMTCDTCVGECGPCQKCQKCQGDRKSEGNVAGARQISIRCPSRRAEEDLMVVSTALIAAKAWPLGPSSFEQIQAGDVEDGRDKLRGAKVMD